MAYYAQHGGDGYNVVYLDGSATYRYDPKGEVSALVWTMPISGWGKTLPGTTRGLFTWLESVWTTQFDPWWGRAGR